MSRSTATIFVCTSCRRLVRSGDGDKGGANEGASEDANENVSKDVSDEDHYDEPGALLVARLESLTSNDPEITVEPVDCLAVCTRACTLALSSIGKWTYVVGDIDPDTHAQDVASAARAFAASTNGIVPWRERPQVFRKGVVARIPPVTASLPQEQK